MGTRPWENTNLSLRENKEEETRNGVVPGAPRSDHEHRANSIEGTRLDEHGNDGLAQSIDSSCPQSSTSVPDVQGEPDDDHEGEKDVERE